MNFTSSGNMALISNALAAYTYISGKTTFVEYAYRDKAFKVCRPMNVCEERTKFFQKNTALPMPTRKSKVNLLSLGAAIVSWPMKSVTFGFG